MLPSNELRELSKRVDINLSGKMSPKGCDIRFRQFYWMMVFNPDGELMSAYNLSNELTAIMKLGLSLPQAFVSSVESGLRAEHSLEDLEQRYWRLSIKLFTRRWRSLCRRYCNGAAPSGVGSKLLKIL